MVIANDHLSVHWNCLFVSNQGAFNLSRISCRSALIAAVLFLTVPNLFSSAALCSVKVASHWAYVIYSSLFTKFMHKLSNMCVSMHVAECESTSSGLFLPVEFRVRSVRRSIRPSVTTWNSGKTSRSIDPRRGREIVY